MGKFRILTAALLAAVALSACSDEPTSPATPTPEAPSAAQLDGIFDQAALEFGVPATLLKSIGYVETRWEMVRGGVEFPGQQAAFGIMALRGERVTQGAQLAKVTPEQVRSDAAANIRAAAALLDLWADEMGIARSDLAAWGPVVARYSGITQVEGQASYVHNDVYATMNRGVVGKTPTGGIAASIMPVRVRAAFQLPENASLAVAPDYPVTGTIWRPSPNYNARPTGSTGGVQMVIIHTCEGSYSSCWSWLTNSAAQASAHYVVNESGSEISQLVREASRAWHIAATYDCSLNSSVLCGLNGVSSNHFTVGIEHGGFASQTTFPSGQLDASARLSCDISKAYGIPRDRQHFVGHGQLQPYNRTDPGPNWPWTDYLNRINTACGATSGTSIVVDNNNANNNAASARFESSTTWQVSSGTAGYYGSNYAFASTTALSDGATFWFYLPAAATKTIDAWWTAGTNRSATAPFIAYNASGAEVGRVSVNQQVNGGAFRTIGTWSFSAGWNKVVLSRWTTEGYVVVADAVRVR
ncbi:N-acetylmuramoyl-L-alanine amidase [Longimicrobium sp.]|uniref:golvesin C-terminal-like domain-containing protein n=1 Tax=Longimicrobium sp. TaxID=2029185 RepID=UPI002E30317A|nr:N-acetylmuramoyl-L-alanine amidase [Longimicrobium sp.]HEX6038353.1 N-acetylmuramoyl-L-alanine amidase [Longimicrobium sp.]